ARLRGGARRFAQALLWAGPHALRRGGAPMTLDFWFDFSSPYAYLGSTQVERVAQKHGAQLIWKPFLLGALFKKIGTPDVPMLAANQPKQRYYAQDLRDWADYWKVDLNWPTRFPMRTVLPLRLVLAAEDRAALSHRIYRAFWVEDRDISDPTV